MSGTFIDGGGHDHAGHGVQSGHGGDCFADCALDGSHDHAGHMLHQHAAGEGGVTLSSLLGLDAHHNGHSFLSHLLGLDHDHLHHGPAGSPTHLSGQAIWTSALQGMKLSNALQGIRVTPSVWLLVMYVGFISWLFLEYWIRHHEPLANAVLGTAAAQSSTATYDRKMMANIRDAFPLRISPDGGTIYCPSPPPVNNGKAPPGAAFGVTPAADPATDANAQPQPYPLTPPLPAPAPMITQPYNAVPLSSYQPPQIVPAQTYGALPAVQPYTPPPVPYPDYTSVNNQPMITSPLQTAVVPGAERMKTIVNR